MALAGIDPQASLQLFLAYHQARQDVLAYHQQLEPLLRQAEQLVSLPLANSVRRNLSELAQQLKADADDLRQRRALFRLADSAMLGQFSAAELSSWQLNVWDLPLDDQQPAGEPTAALMRHEQLDNADLARLLRQLTVQSLQSPWRAAEALAQLGADGLAGLAERIFRQLEAGLHMPEMQAEALALLQALAMFVGLASHAHGGLPESIESYLLPPQAGWQERDQIRHLGMLLAMGRFSMGFAAKAGVFLMDQANRPVVHAASRQHPLKVAARSGKGQPYAAMLNPLEQALRQAHGSAQSALIMLDSIIASWGEADIDTEFYHGLAADQAVAPLLDVIVAEAAVDPAFKDQSWNSLLGLYEWLAQNSGNWPDNSQVWSSIAQLTGLYWPELRSVATEVTQPVLLRVVTSPDAMSLLSVGVGAFTLGHLSEAISVELDPQLSDTQRDRRISSHVDAVGDVYHHVFTAAASVSREPSQKAMSLLASALKFADRKLMKLLLVGGLTPHQRVAATVAAMAVRRFKEDATEQIRQGAPSGEISPQQIFASQLGNRDRAATGGHAPEPTWFELELANKLLQSQPDLAESLVGDAPAEAARWLKHGQITASEEPAFAEWFAQAVNADPPTEFSLVFVHLQREFVNDLLLDATSVAIDGVWEKANHALEISQETQAEWQQWQEAWREQRARR